MACSKYLSTALVTMLVFIMETSVTGNALAATAGGGNTEPAVSSTEKLARAAQNPVASMISLPFQNNTNFNFGPESKTQNVLNVQPVLPFELNDDWNLITRTIVPVISQPGFVPGQDRTDGVGDTVFTAFLSPKDSGEWIWGVGPVVLIPTSSNDRLGVGEWGGGVGVVVLTMQGPWVVGGLVNNVWSSTNDSGAKVNSMAFQPFINYNFSGGWYATTSPIITANWEADSGNKWVVPLGGGFGRIFKIGEQAINAQVQAFYNVESPDNIGPDWTLRFQLQFLFPK